MYFQILKVEVNHKEICANQVSCGRTKQDKHCEDNTLNNNHRGNLVDMYFAPISVNGPKKAFKGVEWKLPVSVLDEISLHRLFSFYTKMEVYYSWRANDLQHGILLLKFVSIRMYRA